MTLANQFTLWMRGLSDPDIALLDKARRGQQSAFEALICQYRSLLHGFIARRVGQGAAEDVMQETLIACWTGLEQYAGRSRFKAWLFGIAAHKCADHHRKRGQTVRQEEELPLDLPDGSNVYEEIELREEVQEMLKRLPNAQREVLELYYYAELSLPEIADALGRNLNTVKYQFYRAHEKAANELKSLEIGSS